MSVPYNASEVIEVREPVLGVRNHSYPDPATATRRFESFCRSLNEAGKPVTVFAVAPVDRELVGSQYFNPACRFEVIHVPAVQRAAFEGGWRAVLCVRCFSR